MTTWTEAIDMYRNDRKEAMQHKEIRDDREEELREFFKNLTTEEWEYLVDLQDKPAERM